ncbi:hypothetical protein [Methylobacterium dankookense]|uniref:Uncharacterized protein n=1 Tax=Methylobacterium dankookense TaxID=560405 RepID=A0A564FSQ4_9HYPH|nr:hypothetical protein [Methylobacterium dankookense]GJD54875.1 hypothetical protein IFDJLNFL_0754 [Methylobacterium dankookense]VUF11093.1 hypothetical protein MTDSW087_00766 [Methylobacterium dankookense]
MQIIRHPRADDSFTALLALALSFIGILLSLAAFERVYEAQTREIESTIDRLRSAS